MANAAITAEAPTATVAIISSVAIVTIAAEAPTATIAIIFSVATAAIAAEVTATAVRSVIAYSPVVHATMASDAGRTVA